MPPEIGDQYYFPTRNLKGVNNIDFCERGSGYKIEMQLKKRQKLFTNVNKKCETNQYNSTFYSLQNYLDNNDIFLAKK